MTGRAGLAVALLAVLAPPVAWAETSLQPLWEFGLGVGAVAFEDYRGAASSHVYPVPVPYVIYRGKFLEANRNGVRGKLLNSDRIELSISANASGPVRNNSARSGMPELRPMLEIGPQLEVHAWRSSDERVKLDLRVPARAAFTLQASPRAVGWVLAPNLNLDVADLAGIKGLSLGVLTGPLFEDVRYNRYIYAVAPQFANPLRPSYDPSGGYAGFQLLTSLSRRYASHWVGAYLRRDTLLGASFLDSPLVKRNSYFSGGVGIAWMIGHSARRVAADE